MLADLAWTVQSTALKVTDKGKTAVQLLCELPAVQHSSHVVCLILETRQACCRQRERECWSPLKGRLNAHHHPWPHLLAWQQVLHLPSLYPVPVHALVTAPEASLVADSSSHHMIWL